MQFSLTNTGIKILFVEGFMHESGYSLLTEESINRRQFRRDMTERLLKATLSPNQTNKQITEDKCQSEILIFHQNWISHFIPELSI